MPGLVEKSHLFPVIGFELGLLPFYSILRCRLYSLRRTRKVNGSPTQCHTECKYARGNKGPGNISLHYHLNVQPTVSLKELKYCLTYQTGRCLGSTLTVYLTSERL